MFYSVSSISSISTMFNFKTQGTAYELTANRINSFFSETAVVETPSLLKPLPQALLQPLPQPDKPMLVRKSSRYQDQDTTRTSTNTYVKYGNDDDSDDSGDDKNGKRKPPPPINFDSAQLKQTMKSMTLSAAHPPVTTRSVKKRFPSPATSATTNQLFWCAYIACKGEAAFDMISNAFVTETEFKYETVERLRGMRLLIKPIFKKHKLSLPNFEAELISSKRTTLQVMTGILICHLKNLLYVDHRLFIEIKASDHHAHSGAHSGGHAGAHAGGDADAEGFVVIEKVKNRYCVYTDPDSTELTRCRGELLRMESLDSPVRSASYYKLGELEAMCKRLALVLPTTGTKKADLYSEILKYIENSGIRV
jgi:hypothetical protein